MCVCACACLSISFFFFFFLHLLTFFADSESCETFVFLNLHPIPTYIQCPVSVLWLYGYYLQRYPPHQVYIPTCI